jgi:thiamine-phosphate pyrophosphorylase
VTDRRERLLAAHLYLVCDEQPDGFLHAALRGGVGIVQLRMKDASEDAILAAAGRFKRACDEHGALLILNDRPELALAAGADGVHLGQDDAPVPDARKLVGDQCLIGLSTHTREQVDAAGDTGADYIGVGPVNQTPTKPGRPAVGLELVRYAASHAGVPFFAIGGIFTTNADAVAAAGATRIAVVRALTEAADPEAVARGLRATLGRTEEAPVGSA